MTLLRQTLQDIEDIIESADSSHCNFDATVVSRVPLDRLKERLDDFRQFVEEYESNFPAEE